MKILCLNLFLRFASEVQTYLNQGYDYFIKKFCNLDKHRFDIKQEVIAKVVSL